MAAAVLRGEVPADGSRFAPAVLQARVPGEHARGIPNGAQDDFLSPHFEGDAAARLQSQ
jgi:hypothetical protein